MPVRGHWLAIANFGDRLGKRYAANSSLWRFDPGRRSVYSIINCVVGNQLD